jgi:hypothetical protein
MFSNIDINAFEVSSASLLSSSVSSSHLAFLIVLYTSKATLES